MADLSLVTYCGLYCGLCTQKCRIPAKASELQEIMKKEGYEYWGDTIPGFTDFWKFLQELARPDPGVNCRTGNCGAPFCTIRKCAREKGIDLCLYCGDYPCKRVLGIAQGYPTLLADGERIRKIGLDAWIKEQEERAETGFAYADIRCYPYTVPAE